RVRSLLSIDVSPFLLDTFSDTLLLHSIPTRRSSDLWPTARPPPSSATRLCWNAAASRRPKRCGWHGPSVYGASISPRMSSTFPRSEEHTSELQSRENLVCRLLLVKKNYVVTKTRSPF